MGGTGLDRLVAALQTQQGFAADALEIVLVDRTGRAPLPGCTWIEAPADDSVFALRRRALEAARGPIVLVTEDHCLPGPGWAAALVEALETRPEAVAAAGPVHDAAEGGAWDRAAFLVDYAALLPDGAHGVSVTDAVPGMNTAYRAEVLRALLEDEPGLLDDFWEGAAHRRLARRGPFLHVPAADLAHVKRWGRAHALEQRYLQARLVAGGRAADLGLPGRVAWALAAAGVPAVVAPRILKPTLRRSGLPPHRLIATLPPMAALVAAWALGEAVGAVLGPGDAAARVV